ncbi:hypothetical protein M405DRAFT_167149 [Rhizopogon salebrosus TDB-379]|nr:hypothetical protein M405DRAFT_167149 [Rhizopogon salebrosus TDB-379]
MLTRVKGRRHRKCVGQFCGGLLSHGTSAREASRYFFGNSPGNEQTTHWFALCGRLPVACSPGHVQISPVITLPGAAVGTPVNPSCAFALTSRGLCPSRSTHMTPVVRVFRLVSGVVGGLPEIACPSSPASFGMFCSP